MPRSSAAERRAGATPATSADAPVTRLRSRRVIGRETGLLVRVDRFTLTLAGVGLALLLLAAVGVTLLVSGRTGGSTPAPSAHGPHVTLDGPGVAGYIAQSYGVSGVACPTVSTPVGGSFLCADASGNAFTVTIINHGRSYSVHPN